MRRLYFWNLGTALALALWSTACSTDDKLSIEELRDPKSCERCHPEHYREWSGSMHAYAADDPVFLAMNRRGQRDTGGALGGFCINCHAPVALKLGLTTDGSNLAEVPQWAKGVTCYFCHNVTSVEGTHNNPLVLANDDTMRGGISDPRPSAAHNSAYSDLIDTDSQKSSVLCGACHDVVTPIANVAVERSYVEWQTTVFAQPNPRSHLSCGQCHMVAKDGAIVGGEATGPVRAFGKREHTFAAIDVAVIDWPEKAAQRSAIDRDLKSVVSAKLCVLPTNGGEITLRLDNTSAGHNFPSGASHDRRAWAEVVAYDAADNIVFQSGVVPVDKDPEDIGDPHLFGMWDKAYKADNSKASFFWEIATIDSSTTLRPAVTLDISDPRFDHSTTKQFPVGSAIAQIAKVTAVVKIRPFPLHVLQDLRTDGVTDAHIAAMPTFDLTGTKLVWTPATATNLCTN